MNTNMKRFKLFAKNVCILVLWTKVASALVGLALVGLRIPPEIFVWNSDTFDNNCIS